MINWNTSRTFRGDVKCCVFTRKNHTDAMTPLLVSLSPTINTTTRITLSNHLHRDSYHSLRPSTPLLLSLSASSYTATRATPCNHYAYQPSTTLLEHHRKFAWSLTRWTHTPRSRRHACTALGLRAEYMITYQVETETTNVS